MTDYITDLYHQEIKQRHGPLDFDDIPACAEACRAYKACLSELPEDTSDRLDGMVFHWIEECNRASFARGFQLGLRLMKWAGA